MIDVTCAVIIQKGRVLATQRSPKMSMAGFWEFPGGKVEHGESNEASLIREIQEELGVIVAIKEQLNPCEWHYQSGVHIQLIPFVCVIESGTLILHEHSALRWLSRGNIWTLEWAEADIPVVHEVASRVVFDMK